jgi:hypothetical protein
VECLEEGSLLKIGQKEYFISSVCTSSAGDKDVREKLMLIDNVLDTHKKIEITADSQKG